MTRLPKKKIGNERLAVSNGMPTQLCSVSESVTIEAGVVVRALAMS